MKSVIRKLLLLLLVAGVIGAVGYGLVPEPVLVDFAELEQGAIRVTVDQDGKTRIRERYVVSAPLAGRLMRIDLDPGDEVKAGETLLATIEPRDPELLDARSIAQAEARVKAAEASLEKMAPILEEMIAGQEFAEAELKRFRDARSSNASAVSTSDVESKLMEFRTRTALLRSARHNEEIAQFELDQARAALLRSRPMPEDEDEQAEKGHYGRNLTIHSPIDGRVLNVYQES
ncbi:MAG: efflux RND transporter periplasmic adaptor subunit, partial [Bythopirellula sp.]